MTYDSNVHMPVVSIRKGCGGYPRIMSYPHGGLVYSINLIPDEDIKSK